MFMICTCIVSVNSYKMYAFSSLIFFSDANRDTADPCEQWFTLRLVSLNNYITFYFVPFIILMTNE